jgi:mono/diheme cytochrome c family protein
MAFGQFSKLVRQPIGQMPPYTMKSLPDKDLADIYAFLQSLPTPPDAATIPALR